MGMASRKEGMDFALRPAWPQDAEAIASVEVAGWQGAYRGLMPDSFLDGLSREEKATGWYESLRKHQSAQRKRVTVAVMGAEVLGFVRVGPSGEEAGVGLVYLLYILPEYWGCGVGKALMQAALSDLREMEMDEAVLWVLRDNHRPRRFYEGLGWRPDERTSAETYGGVALEA